MLTISTVDSRPIVYMPNPLNHDQRKAACLAIAERLKDLAAKRCDGSISQDEFIAAVLEIESNEVTPHALTLTASNRADGWIVIRLKINSTNQICASFEFLPETGEIRHGDTTSSE